MNVGVIICYVQALTEVHRVAITDRGMVAVHFLPESQYPGGTGKFIYKLAILDKKTAPSQTGSIEKHKSTVYPRTVTTLQHVLLLTKTKGSCVHKLLMTTWLLDKSTSVNCVICELKKPMPSDSQSQLKVTRKATQ